jgi:hypothetical protein
VDLYMWSCHEALRFGRRSIQVEVLRLGWNPQNSQPAQVGDLFRKREVEKARALQDQPATPVAVAPAVAPVPTPPQR